MLSEAQVDEWSTRITAAVVAVIYVTVLTAVVLVLNLSINHDSGGIWPFVFWAVVLGRTYEWMATHLREKKHG